MAKIFGKLECLKLKKFDNPHYQKMRKTRLYSLKIKHGLAPILKYLQLLLLSM